MFSRSKPEDTLDNESANPADSSPIKSFQHWTVTWDGSATTLVGKAAKMGMSVSPTKLVTPKNKRVVAVEMRRVPPVVDGGVETEDCLVRVMVKTQSALQSVTGSATGAVGSVVGGTTSMMNVTAGADDDDDDDASVSTVAMSAFAPNHDLGEGGWTASRFEGYKISEQNGGGSNTIPLASEWKTYLELPLRNVEVVGHKKDKVTFKAGGRHTGTKQIRFSSEKEATAFAELMTMLKAGQGERDKKRKMAAMQSLKVDDENEDLNILIEICSAWGIAKADAYGGSDPYVKVTMNGKDVHKTKHLASTLEPVWTVKTGSLFILRTTVSDLFDCHEGLKFEVKDYDKVGGNESLGVASISPRQLFESDGERLIFPLVPDAGHDGVKVTGSLAIRARHATNDDVQFMARLKSGLSKIGDKAPTALAIEGGKSDITSLMTRNTRTLKNLDDPNSPSKLKKYKIRPYADPSRKEETKWMTHEQIQAEAFKRSTKWLDCGTGDLGKIYLEVIGCDNLPNLDAGGIAGNKTDAYVSVVYEDVVLQTDVIDDKLSPRWMPWSKRAFMLRMFHSSSQLFLGVFDFDTGYDDHDSIGRIGIDLSTFHPYTEYILVYNLYNTEKWSERKVRGTITVRLMLEYEKERNLILSALMLPPPKFYVNLQLSKDFHVARYTATGQMGAKSYGQAQIMEYLEELTSYQRVLFHIQEALKNVILWRGHAPVNFGCCTVKLPLRSLCIFVAAVIVVEHPKFLLSFILAGLGFTLSGTLGFRRSNPSKWVRCRTYGYYFRTLILGKGISPPQTIKQYENAEEFEAFEKDWEEKIKTFEREAEEARIENEKKQLELQKEMEAIGDANVDISTQGESSMIGKVTGTVGKLDPLAGLKMQIQNILEQVVLILRFTRNIIIWEENYLCFWLTTALYLLAILCLFVPWGWLIRWITRIVVWVFLGPWMKLVDIFWHSHVKQFLADQQAAAELAQKEQIDAMKMQARIAREDATKLKVIKKAMFGEYISSVPCLKFGRYRSNPTPASEAKPFAAAKLKKEKATWDITRVHGQQLMGDMIPKIEDTVHPDDEEDNEEETVDTEKKPLLANGKKPVYSQ